MNTLEADYYFDLLDTRGSTPANEKYNYRKQPYSFVTTFENPYFALLFKSVRIVTTSHINYSFCIKFRIRLIFQFLNDNTISLSF